MQLFANNCTSSWAKSRDGKAAVLTGGLGHGLFSRVMKMPSISYPALLALRGDTRVLAGGGCCV